MYYEDEKNLYHYSYRKGNEHGERTEVHTAPPAPDPQPVEPPKKKKSGKLGLIAAALCCALIGGCVGGALVGGLSSLKRGSTEINVSDRYVAEVERVKVDGRRVLTMPEVYEANIGSVVSINVSSKGYNAFGQSVQNASAGSGFIITTDGYIVTNYHVVDGAHEIKVTLQDGSEYAAAIIGGDEDYDVAVIKVEGEFAPVVVGDSSKLKIGETIAAIGNPLGELSFSMSQGIVSCTDRAINVDGTPFNMIQIDASINPGNSGGPLVNTYGEVIGIVSAKYTRYSSTTVEGIGFAIPMNDVIALIEDIMTNGYNTNKPYFGITPGTMTAQMAKQYRYEVDKGVFIYSVEEGSAAEKAGLKTGDVILKIDEHEVDSFEQLVAVKKQYSAGDTVKLTVYRGETVELELTFDAAPADTMESAEEQPPQQTVPNYGGYYSNPWDLFNSFFGYGW